jgi:hypothetical protein
MVYILYIYTHPYHPNINDFIERSFRSVKDLTRCMITHLSVYLILIGIKLPHMLVWLGTSYLMQQYIVIRGKLILNGMV